jgi:hypothetical protein
MNDLETHLLTLRAQHAATDAAIAAAAGVDRKTVRAARSGSRTLHAGTARLLLAVDPAALVTVRVPARGTCLRLRALAAMGHSCPRIAAALGVSADRVKLIQRGEITTVECSLAAGVRWLFDQWWDRRPPERDQYERAAAAYARGRAMRGDWCAGAALDEDRLDLPGYVPGSGYRPARGSGIAADVHWRAAS